jgi:Tfp pilus assembly protein PilF
MGGLELGAPTIVNFELSYAQMVQAWDPRTLREELKKLDAEIEKEGRHRSLRAIVLRARQHLEAGSYAEAAVALNRAIPIAEGFNLATLLSLLAQVHEKAGHSKEAVACARKAVEADPGTPIFHNVLGNIYARAARFHEAAKEFKRAAQLSAQPSAPYTFNYGVALFNLGRVREAAAAFRQASKTDPAFADAYFGEACVCYVMSGGASRSMSLTPEAAESLRQYLKLDPQGQYAHHAREMLADYEKQVIGANQNQHKP